ncbi:MAG: hypothetical protein ACOX7U_04640 [Desulfitobacteriia bacterium]|jgi:hypothetical protein
MTEEKRDLHNRIINLAENIIEGLEHIHILLREGKRPYTIEFMVTILEGFTSIEGAIPLVWEKEREDITKLRTNLRNNFSLLVKAYEKEEENEVLEVLETKVLPTAYQWVEGLKNSSGIEH